jgi:tetratricopeptide (TPR) repeat protein
VPAFAFFVLHSLLAGLSPQSTSCALYELRALEDTRRLALEGDDDNLRLAIEQRMTLPEGRCPEVVLARVALLGWIEARELATTGGPVHLLGPTLEYLKELEGFRSGPLAIEAEYAETAIRAAIAAAQDERPEMELLLTHARDLAERLAARARQATWPRSFNLLAGELWFEVDRYEEARRAFERALQSEVSPLALVGLARSLVRLERHADACRAYRALREGPPKLLEEARAYLVTCP